MPLARHSAAEALLAIHEARVELESCPLCKSGRRHPGQAHPDEEPGILAGQKAIAAVFDRWLKRILGALENNPPERVKKSQRHAISRAREPSQPNDEQERSSAAADEEHRANDEAAARREDLRNNAGLFCGDLEAMPFAQCVSEINAPDAEQWCSLLAHDGEVRKDAEFEAKHPREPAGSPRGGWFRPKHGTIADAVRASADELKKKKTAKELYEFAIQHGWNNRSAFPRYKQALLEIGIDYEAIRAAAKAEREQKLADAATHEVELYVDAKASHGRFAITEKNGSPLWYGRFFEDDLDFDGEQSSAELSAAKKAIWMASKIKDAIGAPVIRLTLNVDAQWLTYQDHSGQKGYALTELARRYGIDLHVNWVRGTENPADKFTTAHGWKSWKDNDLKSLGVPLSKQDDEKISKTDAEERGVWRTINGRRVFIREGETAAAAVERSLVEQYGLEEVQRRETEQFKTQLKTWLDSTGMPRKLQDELMSWDYISKSPYSNSFYSMPGKTWDNTPDGILRISDHWNFGSGGRLHEVTDKPVRNNTHWTLAQYDANATKNFYVTVPRSYGEDESKAKELASRWLEGFTGKLQPTADGKAWEAEIQKVGIWRVLETLPLDTDIRRRYEETRAAREAERRQIELAEAKRVAKEEREAIAAGRLFAKVTKREWGGSPRRGLKLLGEKTYYGRVVHKTQSFVTIVTDSGETIRGKDFEILQPLTKTNAEGFGPGVAVNTESVAERFSDSTSKARADIVVNGKIAPPMWSAERIEADQDAIELYDGRRADKTAAGTKTSGVGSGPGGTKAKPAISPSYIETGPGRPQRRLLPEGPRTVPVAESWRLSGIQSKPERWRGVKSFLAKALSLIRKDEPPEPDDLKFDVERILLEAFPDKEAAIKELMEAGLVSAFDGLNDGITRAARELGRDESEIIAVLQQPLRYELKDTAYEYSQRTLERISENIRDMLVDGLNEGLAPREMADIIQDEFDSLSDYEAMRIARTEFARGQVRGAIRSYQDDGIELGRWRAVASGDSCPICWGYHDRIWPLEEILAAYPAHPHCRCAVEPVYELADDEEVETEPPTNVFDDPDLAGNPWPPLEVEKASNARLEKTGPGGGTRNAQEALRTGHIAKFNPCHDERGRFTTARQKASSLFYRRPTRASEEEIDAVETILVRRGETSPAEAAAQVKEGESFWLIPYGLLASAGIGEGHAGTALEALQEAHIFPPGRNFDLLQDAYSWMRDNGFARIMAPAPGRVAIEPPERLTDAQIKTLKEFVDELGDWEIEVDTNRGELARRAIENMIAKSARQVIAEFIGKDAEFESNDPRGDDGRLMAVETGDGDHSLTVAESGGAVRNGREMHLARAVRKNDNPSCVIAVLDEEDAKPFVEFAQEIPDSELYRGDGGQDSCRTRCGREKHIHCTLLSGLEIFDPEPVKEIAADCEPFLLACGRTVLFDDPDKPYVVLAVPLYGGEARRWNKRLKRLPHDEPQHPYRPHLTICCLNRSADAQKYAGDSRFAGKILKITRLEFSAPEVRTEIPLGMPLGKRFNPDQPRDERGRWTEAGANPAAAKELAAKMHAGQMRADGRSKIEHIEAVASKFHGDPLLQTIAYLHDTLEDTALTEQDIREQFGNTVADAVKADTWDRQHESYETYIRRVAEHPLAARVKLADIEDNNRRRPGAPPPPREKEYNWATEYLRRRLRLAK